MFHQVPVIGEFLLIVMIMTALPWFVYFPVHIPPFCLFHHISHVGSEYTRHQIVLQLYGDMKRQHLPLINLRIGGSLQA